MNFSIQTDPLNDTLCEPSLVNENDRTKTTKNQYTHVNTPILADMINEINPYLKEKIENYGNAQMAMEDSKIKDNYKNLKGKKISKVQMRKK